MSSSSDSGDGKTLTWAESAPAWESIEALDWTGLPPAESGAHPFTRREADRYDRHGEIGRGGMGRVFAARDRRLNRDIALKVVHQTSSHPATSERLAQEAWITARLEHPGIVPVYDAGQTPDGQLFYSMRLIRGRTLRAVLSETPDTARRLRLLPAFLAVCNAVAYAHSVGVVHRDLKPDNIMLGRFGEVLVVDWGLARLLSEPEAAEAGPIPAGHGAETAMGAVIGTPMYMSPEQAEAEPSTLRSDVWSLGAVLFEILTGQPPFQGTSAEAIISQVAQAPLPDIRALNPAAPSELIAIATRALQRDPADRYPSAAPLAEEINAWLEGGRVASYDYSSAELLLRLARRWRAPLLVGALAAVLLGIGGAVAWRDNTAERQRAQAAEAAANANLASALIRQAQIALELRARAEAEVLATHALLLHDSPEARGILAAYTHTPRPRLVETLPIEPCWQPWLTDDGGLLCADLTSSTMWDLDTLTPRWESPARLEYLFPTQRGLFVTTRAEASSGQEFSNQVLDLETGETTPVGGEFRYQAISSDGLRGLGQDRQMSWFIETLPGLDRQRLTDIPLSAHRPQSFDYHDRVLLNDKSMPWLVNLQTGETTPLPALAGEDISHILPWTGSDLIVGTSSGRVIRLSGADLTRTLEGVPMLGRVHTIERVGDRVAVLGDNFSVELWDPETAAWISRIPAHGAEYLLSTGDSVWIMNRRQGWRWEFPGLYSPARFHGLSGLSTVLPTADGAHIYTAGSTLHRHRLSDGQRVEIPLPKDTRLIKSAITTPDGSHIFAGISTSGASSVLRVFETSLSPLLSPLSAIRRLGVLWDGSLLLSSYNGHDFLRLRSEKEVENLPVESVYEIESATGGGVTVLLDQTSWGVWHWPAGAEAPIRIAENTLNAHAAATSPDGRTTALANDEKIVILRDGVLTELYRSSTRTYDLDISPNGRWLAGGSMSGQVMIWDLETFEQVLMLDGHARLVSSVAFSHDSTTLLSASWDGTARRWSMGILDADPAELQRTVAEAWGMTLEEALAHRVR